jgi:hypothetical protein
MVLELKMTCTKKSTIKQQAYRIINANGANVDFVVDLCLYGLKFHDMLGPHTCIYSMKGFMESNMTQTKNSTIKYFLVILSKPKNKVFLLMYLTILISDMCMGPTLNFFQFVLVWTEI